MSNYNAPRFGGIRGVTVDTMEDSCTGGKAAGAGGAAGAAVRHSG
jgi:hypothetical protein